jgi:hypothetical protein
MEIHSYQNKTESIHRVWLYSVVFASKTSVAAILLLFISFFVQPIHQALANESVEVEDDATEEVHFNTPAETVVEDTDSDSDIPTESDDSTEVSSEEDSLDESNDIEIVADTETEDINNDYDPDVDLSVVYEPLVEDEVLENNLATTTPGADNQSTSTTTDTIIENPDGENIATTTDNVIVSEENSTSTATSTTEVEGSVDGQNNVDSNSTSTDDTDIGDSTSSQDDDTSGGTDDATTDDVDGSTSDQTDNETVNTNTEDSTSNTESEVNNTAVEDQVIEDGVSDIVSEMVTLTRQLVTEENFYQFSRQSCAPVGDGTFHCTQNSDLIPDSDSVVYAERDESGDMEIYLKTSKGKIERITDNELDDTAPDYDVETMTVVWQRLIDGRYQVIAYDLREEKETQMTFARTNNMEPKVSRDGIVWQAWDGNDWEIMFFDGTYTDVITDNEIQDVTPVIEDGYVLWSILGGDEQEARVYSIESGEIMTISGYEGGVVANPRFVLVYDTKFDNGDVVTQGFDPVTGLSAPIAAKPVDEPIDIPETDAVGEIRALIQNKSSQKETDVISKTVSDADQNSLDLATNASTSEDVVVQTHIQINEFGDEISTSTQEAVGNFELTEYDLVITPTATSTSLEDIADELPLITERVSTTTQN